MKHRKPTFKKIARRHPYDSRSVDAREVMPEAA